MEITKISLKKFAPVKGHIGFVSFVIDDWLYVGNIAVFKRLNSDGIRLVFPIKKVGENKISMFHPLTTDAYYKLEQTILDYMKTYG